MTERACGSCRFYLPEGETDGDCLSMMSGRVKTKAAETCGLFTEGKVTDLALDELPAAPMTEVFP